jgi:hypothetical protein
MFFEILSPRFRTSFGPENDDPNMNTNSLARRRAGSFAMAAAAILVSAAVGLAAGSLGFPIAGGVAAYGVLVILLRKALLRWTGDWDELGPELRPRRVPRGPMAAAVATMALAVSAASARAQQTLFNVPSADVLDKGKVYLEEDTLWRSSDPDFAVFTMRGVYGLGSNVEAGVNFGGFVTPGRSIPTATATMKWQPVKIGSFALTAGAHGLFFLGGSKDGGPSGWFHVHGSYSFPTNTRLTAGGWVATSGYAAPGSTGGGTFGLEQKVNDHLTLAADWFTGRNGIGYLSPGVISAWGPWTFYAGWSIKNGDSKGNGALLELGFLF